MNENSERRAVSLLNTIEQRVDGYDRIERIDLLENLRRTVLNFFITRTGSVTGLERIRNRLIQKLEERLDTDQLEFTEMLALFHALSNYIQLSSDSITSLFKPVAGAESVLAKTISTEDKKSAIEEYFNSLSKEDLEKLDTIDRLLRSTKDDKENKE